MKNSSAFRLDDITPDMKWDNFLRVKAIFDEHQIKPLIGVVPDNQDGLLHFEDNKEDFWEQIRELQKQGWMVAQHGYRHVYVTEKSGVLKINSFSEFAGVEYEEQLFKVTDGKKILEDNEVATSIFMAPGHTYDKNTLRALKERGFEYVTDGYGRVPYAWHGLKFYPCRSGSYKLLLGCNTICLHTNVMCEKDFVALERFILEHRADIVDYKEMLENVPAIKRTICIAIKEKLNLVEFKVKRRIGSLTALQKYMQATNKGSGLFKMFFRVVGVPYCLLLILQEIWRGK